MTFITDHAAALLNGGPLLAFLGMWLVHLRSKRKQSDDVMTKQVQLSMDRERARDDRIAKLEHQREIDRLEAEQREQQCAVQLERVKHRLRNSEAMFDSMFSTLKYVAPDRAGEVLQQFGADWRARRERWAAEDASGIGEVRQNAQVLASAAALVRDTVESMGTAVAA